MRGMNMNLQQISINGNLFSMREIGEILVAGATIAAGVAIASREKTPSELTKAGTVTQLAAVGVRVAGLALAGIGGTALVCTGLGRFRSAGILGGCIGSVIYATRDTAVTKLLAPNVSSLDVILTALWVAAAAGAGLHAGIMGLKNLSKIVGTDARNGLTHVGENRPKTIIFLQTIINYTLPIALGFGLTGGRGLHNLGGAIIASHIGEYCGSVTVTEAFAGLTTIAIRKLADRLIG